jgi:hypothetical protein
MATDPQPPVETARADRPWYVKAAQAIEDGAAASREKVAGATGGVGCLLAALVLPVYLVTLILAVFVILLAPPLIATRAVAGPGQGGARFVVDLAAVGAWGALLVWTWNRVAPRLQIGRYR